MGETPDQIVLVEGATLLSDHLPVLSLPTGYYDFDSCYLNGTKENAWLKFMNYSQIK